MTIIEIINNVIAGGLLGALGQGIRIAVGLKKLSEENSASAVSGEDREPFQSSRLLISIFIGFVAGALGMLIKGPDLANEDGFGTESVVTIIAIGYAGADFIEGFMMNYGNKFNATTPPTPPATPPATTEVTVQEDIVG